MSKNGFFFGQQWARILVKFVAHRLPRSGINQLFTKPSALDFQYVNQMEEQVLKDLVREIPLAEPVVCINHLFPTFLVG